METKIQFHLGKPALILPPPAETCAFNERIQKVVVDVEDLMDEHEIDESVGCESKVLGATDVEVEEERERMRREEEVHPHEVKDQSFV